MHLLIWMLEQCFRSCLFLYPRAFQADFRAEMLMVFQLRLHDYRHAGAMMLLWFGLREIGDLLIGAAKAHLHYIAGRGDHPGSGRRIWLGYALIWLSCLNLLVMLQTDPWLRYQHGLPIALGIGLAISTLWLHSSRWRMVGLVSAGTILAYQFPLYPGMVVRLLPFFLVPLLWFNRPMPASTANQRPKLFTALSGLIVCAALIPVWAGMWFMFAAATEVFLAPWSEAPPDWREPEGVSSWVNAFFSGRPGAYLPAWIAVGGSAVGLAQRLRHPGTRVDTVLIYFIIGTGSLLLATVPIGRLFPAPATELGDSGYQLTWPGIVLLLTHMIGTPWLGWRLSRPTPRPGQSHV